MCLVSENSIETQASFRVLEIQSLCCDAHALQIRSACAQTNGLPKYDKVTRCQVWGFALDIGVSAKKRQTVEESCCVCEMTGQMWHLKG